MNNINNTKINGLNIKNYFIILDKKLEKFKLLSNFNIKVIAISLMVIEHFFKIFMHYMAMRNIYIGNFDIQTFAIRYIYHLTSLSFPLFCFFIVEGFQHTKNLKKYMLILLIFGFISEIPLDFAFFLFSPFNKDEIIGKIFYLGYQNVFFTLFLGVLCLYIIRYVEQNISNKIKSIFLKILSIILISILANIINCDYEYRGILFISFFYIFRKNRIYQILAYLLLIIFMYNEQPGIYNFIWCLIIYLYNGKLYNNMNIKHNPKVKYIFYWIYPLHLILFGLINFYLLKYYG